MTKHQHDIAGLCRGAAEIWLGESDSERRDALLVAHLNAFRETVKRSTRTITKDTSTMPTHGLSASHEFTKALDARISSGSISKQAAFESLQAQAERLRQDGESSAQAFARCYANGLNSRLPDGPQIMAKVNAMPNDQPKIVDGGYRRPADDGDDADAQLSAIVAGIMSERKCTRSQAYDLALRTTGGAAAYRASLARSRQANS